MTDEIELWAPNATRVDLDLGLDLGPAVGGALPMTPSATRPGWFHATLPAEAERYAFRLDGGPPRPDPRSRRQPDGVHAPSAPDRGQDTFAWTDAAWQGRPLPTSTIYELHIGTFTPGGTFDAAVEKLDHLVALGIDFVEIMPVAAFNGDHGWGYDGVALWAVHEPYGGPEGLRRFVDACHARGLGVLLDVVYNHLGPSGNYLAEFGPYFNDAHVTPWGAAVNLDGAGSDEVRAFIIDNALFWLRDHHIDGLRLDAVHALADTRAVHILEELSEAVDALAASTGRHLHLIAETDRNDPRTVTPREDGGQGIGAQWSDDFHHSLHSALTGERQGYYCDFGELAAIAKTLTAAYFHNGTYSTFRARHHGRPVDTARIDAARFVVSLQTHDQVGNRAQGDRIGTGLSAGLRKVGAALLLTAPFTPQLFMGEEWAAATPWQYFTSHPEPELADAVRKGRRAEFAYYGWSAEDVPDPQDPATFARSKLQWHEPAEQDHADLLAWYQALIALRKSEPALSDPTFANVEVQVNEQDRWLLIRRGPLHVAANLAPEPRTIPVAAREIVLSSTPDAHLHEGAITLPPESVAVVR